MAGLPIPDPNAPFYTYTICWPRGDGWEALLAGFISSLVLETTWDPETGDIEQITERGEEVWLENFHIYINEIGEGCKNMFDKFPLHQRDSGNGTSQTIPWDIELGPVPAGERWVVEHVSWISFAPHSLPDLIRGTDDFAVFWRPEDTSTGVLRTNDSILRLDEGEKARFVFNTTSAGLWILNWFGYKQAT